MQPDTFITTAFDDWLSSELSTADVRAVESGDAGSFTWNSVQESGFADAMVSEDAGGAGANLATVGELAFLCGKHAVPFPLATTIFVRPVLAGQGADVPSGPITIARGSKLDTGALACRDVPFALASEWVLVVHEEQATVLRRTDGRTTASGIHGSQLADVEWDALPAGAVALTTARDWSAAGAAIYAALIAGASTRILSLALAYGTERKQFGKPIAAFQAVQQRLAVLAELVFAARIAAQQAFAGNAIDVVRSAVAKSRTSRAVPEINAIGHMVFGAIGITEECDLQLYTRRLTEWRQTFAGEKYWDRVIGTRILASDGDALQMLRATAG